MCNNPVIAAPLPGSTFTSLLQDFLFSFLFCLVSRCSSVSICCRRTEERERETEKEKGRERGKEQGYAAGSGRVRKWIEKIRVSHRTRWNERLMQKYKNQSACFVGRGSAMERERRNGGKEPKRTGSPARPRTVQPAYRVRVSLNELANCSQRCTRSALPCSSDPRDITIRKEKVKYSGQERKRQRMRERERETYNWSTAFPALL